MQSRRPLVLRVFTTGYKRSFGRKYSHVVCSSSGGGIHFSMQIPCNFQDKRVTFPGMPEVGNLVGFSLTVEGNLCLGLGGEDVSFAKRAPRRHLYSLGGLQECLGTSSPYGRAFAVTG